MEIFVYTAEEKVPFQESYLPLGAFEKIIFSNNFREGQDNFDEDEVESLFKSIDNIDATVFYVPSEIENKFTKLLGNLFNITQWEKEDIAMTSSKDASGVFGWKELSQFFEKMTLDWIIKPIHKIMIKGQTKECPKECVDLLNDTVSGEAIEAIVIFDLKYDTIFCESKSESESKVDIDLHIIKSLIKVKNATNNKFSDNAENASENYKEYGHFYKENVGIFFFHFINDLNLVILFLAEPEESLIGSLSVTTKECVSDIRACLSNWRKTS